MISKDQYNLLKQATKSKELCVDDLNETELEQAKFLYKNKFLVVSERKTSSSNGITGIQHLANTKCLNQERLKCISLNLLSINGGFLLLFLLELLLSR